MMNTRWSLLQQNSPILVALYMFSMGNTEPRLYNSTFASAGINCVVVTKTLTQLLLCVYVWEREIVFFFFCCISYSPQCYNDRGWWCWRDRPGADDWQGLERSGQPWVCESLNLCPQLEPRLSLSRPQQPWKRSWTKPHIHN